MATSLMQLVCRMTKLGWAEDDAFRGVVDDANALLTKGSSVGAPRRLALPGAALLGPPCLARLPCATCPSLPPLRRPSPLSTQGGSAPHYLLGLRLLGLLVAEMNAPTPGRSLTQHRKVAVGFRDSALYRVFQLSLAALRNLAGGGAAAVAAGGAAGMDSKLREQVRGRARARVY